jgi:hypothetical protein
MKRIPRRELALAILGYRKRHGSISYQHEDYEGGRSPFAEVAVQAGEGTITWIIRLGGMMRIPLIDP